MFLRKEKSSRYYQVIYFVNGRRTKISTKKTTEEEALKFLSHFNPDAPVIIPAAPKNILLSRFRNEYINFVSRSKSKHYLKSIKLSFSQLLSFSGDQYLQKLNPRILDNFISTTFSRAPKAASLYYRTLKAAFSKAVAWEYLSENPLKKIKAPKVAKTLPVFISELEFQLIFGNTSEPYLKDLFLTAFYTGMRQAELVNMKWDWIDLNQNIITVKNSKSFTTKSKKERIIPICSTLRNTLLSNFPKIVNISNDEPANSVGGFVFTHIPGIKLNEDYVCKKFKKVVRLVSLNDKIHFHTLRHSFASMLVQRGVSLYVVKELLGHEDLSTTQIYSHLQKQNLMDAVNLL